MPRLCCCAQSAVLGRAAVLVALGLSAAATAQELVDDAALLNWQQWRPLDQAVEDRNELQISLRQLENGLGLPSAFTHVYRVPGSHDQLMRVNGGVYAVFPESIYAPTVTGPVPVVPAGTVFHLGSPFAGSGSFASTGERFGLAPSSVELGLGATLGPVADPSSVRLDLRLGERVDSYFDGDPNLVGPPESYRSRPMDGPRTVANDPAYRWQRIRSIVRSGASGSGR